MASLQLNDTNNKLGLYQEAERKLFNSEYGRITDTTKMKQDFLARFNNALDTLTLWILNADTRWQHDDTNYTTYPEFTETLVEGQHDYPYELEFLKIHRMAVKNSDGNFVYLKGVDPIDYDMPLAEFYSTNGMPVVYDKTANSPKVYPAPDDGSSVTLSEGLKAWVQRVPDYWTINDNTKVPGVPSPFHECIAVLASYSYASDNQMDSKKNDLFQQLYNQEDGWKVRIENHYSRRDVDDKPHIGVGSSRNLSKLR